METASKQKTKTKTKILSETATKVVSERQGFCVAGVGSCVLYVGGNSNNTTNDGAGYVNVNNGLTNTNTNNGSRLATKFSKLPSSKLQTESQNFLHLIVGELTVALRGVVNMFELNPAYKSLVARFVHTTSGCLNGKGELMHSFGVPWKGFTSL